MKKIILLFVMLNTVKHLTAQNVGIGTVTPGEKLDVNGNVNVQGNIKVNGNAGNSGQVLMMDGNGQQKWANVFGYKHRIEFYSNGTWTVPVGVTEIMIEAIGAGGGGAKGGGGGSGAYAIGIYKVFQGQVITNVIGAAGTGAPSEGGQGTSGGFSSAQFGASAITISAHGGQGASATTAGLGAIEYNIGGDSLIYKQGLYGLNGAPTVEAYSQYNATTFVTQRKYGDGGACMYNPNTVQSGTFFSFYTQSLANISIYYGAASGANANYAYGSGGGGGNRPLIYWGIGGGGGLIAISY